ncbi:MAG: 3-hydroxyacyl-CoA dehydrogenase family protein [Bacteroidales bacterium]|nr:3-hydroxyacyl-CoA dehydrogenase family protein [Bacteroidales bacterium]
MDYADRLKNVAVIGAAGKMGSGILLLTALEMADLMLAPVNAGKTFVLQAIDVSDAGLTGLVSYLRTQVVKAAEKKTVALRKTYAHRADLIENEDIINAYVNDVMSIVRCSTRIETAYDASLVFEAASENPDLKIKLFTEIDKNSKLSPWFFTNTSSIPIGYLEEKGGLKGRVIGFHFYNPPAIQKLVELITTENTIPGLTEFALMYAKNLRKTIVRSNDVAGFIGNGHFMRDILHALAETEKLQKEFSFPESAYVMNRISQDFLVRPMGIYQLIDYVGVDVCKYIMQVMNPYMKDENLHHPLLDLMISLNVKGGQNSDGSQKDGFLKYERGRPTSIYDPGQKAYVSIDSFKPKMDAWIGDIPNKEIQWKNIVRDADKDNKLSTFFGSMKNVHTHGSSLAVVYGNKSLQIAKRLVNNNVAHNDTDVNTVLMTGFFHAYGPVNNYFD